MTSIDEIERILAEHCLSYGAKRLPRGHFRVDTKLLYLDGSSIGVFLKNPGGLEGCESVLTDFGNTFAKLLEYQVDPFLKPRPNTIAELIESLGVQLIEDRLEIAPISLGDISDSVANLAQACLRVSCLILTKKNTQRQTFSEEIEAAVAATGLDSVAKFKHQIPNFRPIEVDYRIRGKHRFSSIIGLGPSREQAAKVFCKWYDLEHAGVSDSRITVFDDRREIKRTEDLFRLAKISEIVPISARSRLSELLNAA